MKNKAISSSDPQALEKLTAKLERLETHHAHMKAANAHYRKHGTCKGMEGVSDEQAAKLDEQAVNGKWEKKPFDSYDLTNNNGAIKQVKERIAAVEKKQNVGYAGWDFQGGKAVANTELDRLQLFFDEKPNAELRQQLKYRGFKWAPSQDAWQRHLNDNGIYAASCIKAIQPVSGESVFAHQPKAPAKTAAAVR